MLENPERNSRSQVTAAINNHLAVAIGLTNILERRLCRSNRGDGEALQIICQIREAAVAATFETEAIGAQDVSGTSKT